MRKLFLSLLIIPLLSFQCEPGEPCQASVKQKSKPNLITVENLQSTYNVGDIIWFNSTLESNQNFESQADAIDLLSYELDFAWGVQFYKTSVYNPEIFLCLNSTTTEITDGSLNETMGCNLFVYEKGNNELKSRVGIKLLETGNYKLSIYSISNFRETGLNCDDKALDIRTTFSNNNQQTINFTVE